MKGILNFIKSLFGRKEANEITTPQSSIKLVTMWEGGTKIQIDIDKIRFAFICLNYEDMRHLEKAVESINTVLKQCMPSLWSKSFACKYTGFCCEENKTGYPDFTALPHALQEKGLSKLSSIVLHDCILSFDRGKTNSKIYIGFAYDDNEPKIILSYTDSIIPK